jgi:hypothetical protein
VLSRSATASLGAGLDNNPMSRPSNVSIPNVTSTEHYDEAWNDTLCLNS